MSYGLAISSRYKSVVLDAGDTIVDLGAPDPFPVLAPADVIVRRTRAGVQSVLALDVDYAVSLLDQLPGARVTLSTGALQDDEIEVIGARPIARPTDLEDGQKLNDDTLNAEFDALIIEAQEARRDIDRSWKSTFGATGGTISPGDDGELAKFAMGSLVGSGENVSTIEGATVAASNAAIAAGLAAAAAEAAAATVNLPTIGIDAAASLLFVNPAGDGYDLHKEDAALAIMAPGFTARGDVPARAGFFKDDDPATQVHRFRDRVLFGDAVKYTGNRSGANGYGGDWLTENGASYFIKNSQVAVLGDETVGRYGLLGAVRGGGIGVAGVVLNENAAAGRAGYFEAFHKGTAVASSGIEIQVGNYTATDTVPNAYSMTGVRALFLSAEGGLGYTAGDADTPVTPASYAAAAAVDIAGGSQASVNEWQRFHAGIVFRNNSLFRGTTGLTGNATAISMAQKHEIEWKASSAVKGAKIRSDVTATAGEDVAIIFANTQVTVGGKDERAIVLFKDDTTGAGAVNYIQIANSRTNVPSAIRAKGTDANAGLDLGALGIGVIRFQSHDGAGEHLRIVPASQAVNYSAATGGVAGINPRLAAAGADTNLSMVVRGKGTGGVRLEDGAAAAKIETSTTGIGFFGAAPVVKQTIGAALNTGGSETNTNLATRINEIRTAMINFGLAA